MAEKENLAPLLGAGRASKTFCLAAERSGDKPNCLRLQALTGAKRVRLQYLARRLHALGERPLFEFLTEIERGADLLPTLERYAALSPNFIREHGGDRFAKPRLVVTDGGAPEWWPRLKG
jgi:hypothetical protein